MGGGRRPFFALVTAVTGLYICMRGGIKESHTHLGVRMVELLRSSETGRRPRAQSRPAWTPTHGAPARAQDPPTWKVPSGMSGTSGTSGKTSSSGPEANTILMTGAFPVGSWMWKWGACCGATKQRFPIVVFFFFCSKAREKKTHIVRCCVQRVAPVLMRTCLFLPLLD